MRRHMFVLVPTLLMTSSQAFGNEVMTDRCSGDVVIANSYNGSVSDVGGVMLTRDSTGNTSWSRPVQVGLSQYGQIRWFCNSTTGNWADIGTWQIDETTLGTKASFDVGGNLMLEPDPHVQLGSGAWDGWTAERSRCGNRTSHIRARLGPDRLLQIECLDNIGSVSAPLSSLGSCADYVQGHIAWDYSGSTQWASSNLDQLCAGAEDSVEPGLCFLHTMFGGVNWGGGTTWDWQNALNLCEGSLDAASTIHCFEYYVANGVDWSTAISYCGYR